MADSKKYNGSTWEHSLRKLGTSTDTITTLPADLYADGNNATVGISGNMEQNGTPTPDNPIQPSECGERTGNFFDANWLSNNTGIGSNGEPYPYNNRVASYTPIILTGNSVTLSFRGAVNAIYSLFDSNDTLLERTSNIASGAIINTTGAAKMYLCFYKMSGATTTDDVSNIMVSSTAKPYEPYGYKIPISSGNTTTNVYLGEVESTRRIKKLVLDGTENWTAGGGNSRYIISVNNIQNYAICSHFAFGDSLDSNEFDVVPNRLQIRFNNAGYTTIEAWQTFLAQQYAAGTPVCVWYVLATEETGIVNEPIRKIGTYADTISGISIPTIAGANSFDVLTTLKPSEVNLTYTGWHDATVKEWDGSEWQ